MSRTLKQFLTALLGGFVALSLVLLVHAQDQSGFISIDCGLPENSSYVESTTGINYISDAAFIDNIGESKLMLPEYRKFYREPYISLRSFPQGIRNCYKINVTSGTKYLIRALFYYGNYDGQSKLPEFELHLGLNLWGSVTFEKASTPPSTPFQEKELIHVPLRSYIHVCLVNTGSGVPFISAIELRPLPNASYPTQTPKESLALDWRYDTGQIAPFTSYKYPKDIHDRFWEPFEREDLTQIGTSSALNLGSNTLYQVPSGVMCTAAMPKLASVPLNFSWPHADNNESYYMYMHFAEVQKLQANQSRQMYVTKNGEPFIEPFTPKYLYTTTVDSGAMSGGINNFSIFTAKNSVLSPILNAIEMYMVKQFLQSETNQEDGKQFFLRQAFIT
ncbi:hypothetical protein CerSpe_106330 [Prunus speciosa]